MTFKDLIHFFRYPVACASKLTPQSRRDHNCIVWWGPDFCFFQYVLTCLFQYVSLLSYPRRCPFLLTGDMCFHCFFTVFFIAGAPAGCPSKTFVDNLFKSEAFRNNFCDNPLNCDNDSQCGARFVCCPVQQCGERKKCFSTGG